MSPSLFVGAAAHKPIWLLPMGWRNSAPSSKRLLPQGNHGVPTVPHHALPYHRGRSVITGSPVVQPPPVAAQSLTSPSACLKPLPFGISSTTSDFVWYSPQLTSVPPCRPVCCQSTPPPRPSQLLHHHVYGLQCPLPLPSCTFLPWAFEPV
jgi:hypothetical protein